MSSFKVLLSIVFSMLLIEANAINLATINKAKGSIAGIAGIAGDVTGSKDCVAMDGCQICWDMKGTLVGIKWKYIATCWETCTGKRVKGPFKSSGSGAIEHCMDRL